MEPLPKGTVGDVDSWEQLSGSERDVFITVLDIQRDQDPIGSQVCEELAGLASEKTVYRCLKSLSEKGYLAENSLESDRRKSIFEPTDAGFAQFYKIRTREIDIIADIEDDFDE